MSGIVLTDYLDEVVNLAVDYLGAERGTTVLVEG